LAAEPAAAAAAAALALLPLDDDVVAADSEGEADEDDAAAGGDDADDVLKAIDDDDDAPTTTTESCQRAEPVFARDEAVGAPDEEPAIAALTPDESIFCSPAAAAEVGGDVDDEEDDGCNDSGAAVEAARGRGADDAAEGTGLSAIGRLGRSRTATEMGCC